LIPKAAERYRWSASGRKITIRICRVKPGKSGSRGYTLGYTGGMFIMHTLTIPQHSDPVARIGLIGFVVALIGLAFAPGQPLAQPQTAEAAQPIILVATPTPALPTIAPIGASGEPTAAPAGGQTEITSTRRWGINCRQTGKSSASRRADADRRQCRRSPEGRR
jgi:hypothetical protein